MSIRSSRMERVHVAHERTDRGRGRLRACLGPFLAFLLLAMFVAACGDDSDDSAATATTDPASQGDDETTTSEAADDWQQTLNAANEEGEVVVYSVGVPTANDALVEAFEDAYPDISVELVGLKENENVQRLEAEYDSGSTGGDVTINTGVNFLEEKSAEEGWFVELLGPDVEAARPNDPFDFDNRTILTVLAPFGFGWNSNEVDSPPDFEDLAGEEFRGRLGLYDPTSSPFSVLYYRALEENFGEDLFRQLAANEPRYYPSVVPLAQAAGAGEVNAIDALTRTAITPDLPVEIGFIDSPPSAAIFAAATDFGENPNAAQVFINYMMSQDGQEVWADGQVAMIDGISTAEFTVEEVTIIGGTPPLATPEEIEADRARYAEIFGL